MIDSVKELLNRRTEIAERIKREYCPFFDYKIELTRKTVYKISFRINDQERVIRIDPQFPEKEFEDVVKEIENVKDAILQTARSAVIKDAKEKLRNRINGNTYCGHAIRWTYAFELDETGLMCQEDNLFLPVEYKEIFGKNTYSVTVDNGWEDKAEEYFRENVGSQRFYKRVKCPEPLKEMVSEFAASQSMIFSGHEKYICSMSKEIIPDKDDQPRYSFDFGDFLKEGDGWKYIKGSGTYDIYAADSKRYMDKFSSLNMSISSADVRGCKILYVEGPGMIYGTTKIKVAYGPWFKDYEITADPCCWEKSVDDQIISKCKECEELVWRKLNQCFDDPLCRDVAELFSVNKKLGASKAAMNLIDGDVSVKSINNSGTYKDYTKEKIAEMIHKLIRCKVLKRENSEKDGKTYVFYSITAWGKGMLELYVLKHKE